MSRTITVGILVALIVAGGLFSWYLFLQKEQNNLATLQNRRGLGEDAPIADVRGSTFQNTVGGLGGTGNTSGNPKGAVGNESSRNSAQGGTRQGTGLSFGFGQALQNIAEQLGITETETLPVPEPILPRIARVHNTPIAGMRFFGIGTSTLRYVERSTGHVFEVHPRTGVVRRLTNTLIPRIYTAQFGGDGTLIASTFDDLEKITTFTATITATSAPAFSALEPQSLGSDVIHTSPGFASSTLVSLVRSTIGTSLISSRWDGSNPSALFTSTLSHWNVFPRKNDVVLVEKSATGISGSAFILKNKTITPLIRNIPGLMLLPHASSSAYLFSSDTGSVSLSARTSPEATTQVLPLKTVAEKCVWAPYIREGGALIAYCAVPRTTTPGRFVDEWYQGLLHTSDTWWQVNVSTGEVEELLDLEINEDVNVEHPVIDSEGTYIAFTNASDKSLWIFRIKE